MQDEGFYLAAYLTLRSVSKHATLYEVVVVFLHGVNNLGDTLIFDGGGFENGGAPVGLGFIVLATYGVKAEQHSQFSYCLVGPRFVGFADNEDVGNLQNTSFDGLDIVTHPRSSHHHDRLSGTHHLDFGLSSTNCFNDNGVVASRIHSSYNITGRGGEPAQATATP